jgi:TetR/AcrR family transcriptional regulator, tetracycline repressor protein
MAEQDSAKRGRGERAGLSREAVLRATRRLVERDGLDRLSLRRLSAELGVAPNAIYSYFDGKVALVDALLDELLGEIALPSPDRGDWRDRLIALMDSSRRLLLAHPDLIPALLTRPARGRNGRRLGEATLALLAEGHIRGERAVEALRALLVFSLGFAAMEAPRRADPAGRARVEESAVAFASDEELPHLRASAALLAQHADDRSFENGLRWLLAGIEREEGRPGGRPSR